MSVTHAAPNDAERVREAVRKRYAEAAKQVLSGNGHCGGGSSRDVITSDLYTADEEGLVPKDAIAASLGCGNPTALAELREGETVLDLGSGGGIDVLLSAKRVGSTGKAIGLDMTDEMLALAEENKRKAGAMNAEFLKGTIESIPLPDNFVDVIVSNCVINLSADKDAVLREAYRVLKPGGRLAVSDIVLRRELPEAARRNLELWSGCVSGALLDSDYRSKLKAAGFQEVTIEPTRVYESPEEIMDPAICCGEEGPGCWPVELNGSIASAFIKARKQAVRQEG